MSGFHIISRVVWGKLKAHIAPWRRDAKPCGVKTDGNPRDAPHHQGNSQRTRDSNFMSFLHTVPGTRIEKGYCYYRGPVIRSVVVSKRVSRMRICMTQHPGISAGRRMLSNGEHDAISCARRDSQRRFPREFTGLVRRLRLWRMHVDFFSLYEFFSRKLRKFHTTSMWQNKFSSDNSCEPG